MAGIPALVARTGYTGEDGFELFVETGRARGAVGHAARRRSARPRDPAVGLGARDTLRLEAGMPLYGNELDLDDEPIRGGSGPRREARQAGDFVGRAALAKVAADGPSRRLVGLTVEGGASPATATRSTSGDRRSGVVTSGTQSPTLGVPIAMAYVAPDDAETGTMVDVEIRDARVPARIVATAVLPEAELELSACPSDLRYTKDHEWVRVDGDEAVVGITAYAAEQLGDIVFVELPDAGKPSTSSRRSASSSRSRR